MWHHTVDLISTSRCLRMMRPFMPVVYDPCKGAVLTISVFSSDSLCCWSEHWAFTSMWRNASLLSSSTSIGLFVILRYWTYIWYMHLQFFSYSVGSYSALLFWWCSLFKALKFLVVMKPNYTFYNLFAVSFVSYVWNHYNVQVVFLLEFYSFSYCIFILFFCHPTLWCMCVCLCRHLGACVWQSEDNLLHWLVFFLACNGLLSLLHKASWMYFPFLTSLVTVRMLVRMLIL